MRWLALLLLMATINSASASVNDLISEGRLAEAFDSLQAANGDAVGKPEYLFIRGLEEQSGENSVSYLKDFINQNPDLTLLSDWARLVIGKYYLAQDLHVVAQKQFEEINTRGVFGPEATYLAARCYLLAGEFDKSEKAFQKAAENLIGKKAKGKPVSPNYYYYWAILGQGESKMAMDKYTDAEKLFNQLLEPDLDDDIFPLALLNLSILAKKNNKQEKVEHYLNLYKDQYGTPPLSMVKPDTLENQAASQAPTDEQTDKILNNKYYIQIGVFSKKQNAEQSAAIYRKSRYKSAVEEYTSQGQKFYRVILGSYSSKQEANFIKDRLEKAAGEKYTLLVR